MKPVVCVNRGEFVVLVLFFVAVPFLLFACAASYHDKSMPSSLVSATLSGNEHQQLLNSCHCLSLLVSLLAHLICSLRGTNCMLGQSGLLPTTQHARIEQTNSCVEAVQLIAFAKNKCLLCNHELPSSFCVGLFHRERCTCAHRLECKRWDRQGRLHHFCCLIYTVQERILLF